MATKVDRRRLFALGGLGAFGAGTANAGPELNLDGGGIVVKIRKNCAGWEVLVPDWEGDQQYIVTFVPVVKWMNLNEYLAMFEDQ